MVFATGNSGPTDQTVGAPATAKNVISVGAAENVRPLGGFDRCDVSDSAADSANDMSSFSSRGPTLDGRKKPEIVFSQEDEILEICTARGVIAQPPRPRALP